MFENIVKFFKNFGKKEKGKESSDTAKERLHLVLMQDRANVSADFLELMKQEIIEVIKKYIDVDEKEIDVRLTNKTNEDGTVGAPALYANIPIVTIKDEARKANVPHEKNEENKCNNTNNNVKKEENNEKEKIEKTMEDANEIKEEITEQKNVEEKLEEAKKEKEESKPKKEDEKADIKVEELREDKVVSGEKEIIEEKTEISEKQEDETKGIEKTKIEQNKTE